MDWKVQMDELLVLDTCTMGFSIDKVTPISNHDKFLPLLRLGMAILRCLQYKSKLTCLSYSTLLGIAKLEVPICERL